MEHTVQCSRCWPVLQACSFTAAGMYVCACILHSWLLIRGEKGSVCEINCGIFQQYFYFVHKLLSLHLISEILKFEICKTDLALSVI